MIRGKEQSEDTSEKKSKKNNESEWVIGGIDRQTKKYSIIIRLLIMQIEIHFKGKHFFRLDQKFMEFNFLHCDNFVHQLKADESLYELAKKDLIR